MYADIRSEVGKIVQEKKERLSKVKEIEVKRKIEFQKPLLKIKIKIVQMQKFKYL